MTTLIWHDDDARLEWERLHLYIKHRQGQYARRAGGRASMHALEHTGATIQTR